MGGDRPSHALATELYQAGFDGIYYTARHDPAFLERSIAVFGTPSTAKLFTLSTGPVPAGLVDEVARDFGLTVLPL